MKALGGLCAAVLLTAVLAAAPHVATAGIPAPAGWAVLVEHNSFAGRYHSLPVGYINSTRMLTALMRRGWPADRILLLRDDLDRALLARATGWLAERVRAGEAAVLYVAGEYQYYERDLSWSATLPELWQRIPTSQRVLIVESCFAERLTAAVGRGPGLGLPAVGRDEWDWWGLRGGDHLIRGGTFTYFLSRALTSQFTEAPLDFRAAFAEAVAGSQQYFRNVLATTRGALDPYHARGAFPERYAVFPNPHLIQGTGDWASSSLPPHAP